LRIFKADIGLLIFARIFGTSRLKIGVFGDNIGRGGAMLTPQRTRFYFWGSNVCVNFDENWSRNATV